MTEDESKLVVDHAKTVLRMHEAVRHVRAHINESGFDLANFGGAAMSLSRYSQLRLSKALYPLIVAELDAVAVAAEKVPLLPESIKPKPYEPML